MSHYLYQTEGFIIGSRPIGEGSRILDLVTAHFGRVAALAQGARELRSKLRYQLIDLAFTRVSLVRGREFWRLVGAEPIIDFDTVLLLSHSYHRAIIARLAFLFRRFLTADESAASRQLYAEIRSAVSFLIRNNLSAEERGYYEIAAVWRFLAKLGYGRRTPTLESILSPADWNRHLLMTTAACQAEVVASINEALYHSHL